MALRGTPVHAFLLGLWWLPMLTHAQAYNYPNGSTVDDFTVTDVNGTVYDLYDLNAQGKYVFLDFFTLWCAPCQQTAAYWAELYQSYGCNSGQLVCLSLDMEVNSAAEVAEYEASYMGSFAYPPVVTGALAMSDVFGVGNAPNYCLIGPDHVMISNFVWPVGSMADFVAAFPAGSGITMQSCATDVPEGAVSEALLHPNPTSGRIHTGDRQVARVRVYEASGRPLAVLPVNGGAAQLPEQAAGLYVIELLDPRGNVLGRARMVRE